jgi:hypothetical protein
MNAVDMVAGNMTVDGAAAEGTVDLDASAYKGNLLVVDRRSMNARNLIAADSSVRIADGSRSQTCVRNCLTDAM